MPRLARHRTTDEFLSLDVRKLLRDARSLGPMAFCMVVTWEGGASAGAAYDLAARRLELSYGFDGGVQRTHEIALASTVPRFGGARWWARCPGCDARRAVLYLDAIGPRCRVCLGLVYTSTREEAFARACGRRNKLCARIGGHVMGRIPLRPRGRWRRTWARDVEAYRAAEAAVSGELRPLLERAEGHIERLHAHLSPPPLDSSAWRARAS